MDILGVLKLVPRSQVISPHLNGLIQCYGQAFPAYVCDGDIGALSFVFDPPRIRRYPGAACRDIESMTFHYLFYAHRLSPRFL